MTDQLDTTAIRALKSKRSKCADVGNLDLSNVPESHETIWLQWGDNGGDYDTWCANNVNDEDIPYTRADLVYALCDALESERAEVERIGRELNVAKYGQPDFAWSVHLACMDELRAENERLRGMLRDGCDLMAIEVDALKCGISINDEMRPGPEDQHTVDAINELEGWIDRAGRAALAQKDGEA